MALLAKPLGIFQSLELVALQAEDLPQVVRPDEHRVDVFVVLVDLVHLRKVEVDVEPVGSLERRRRLAHLGKIQVNFSTLINSRNRL